MDLSVFMIFVVKYILFYDRYYELSFLEFVEIFFSLLDIFFWIREEFVVLFVDDYEEIEFFFFILKLFSFVF